MPLTLLFPLHNTAALAIFLIQEEIATDFNDLGKLLLGGFVLAVGVAIALTFVRLRLRDKKAPTSEFISISSSSTNLQVGKGAKRSAPPL